ncbi:hypothetical protein PR202_ga13456 [Eleusine coracana subsp. coracana]|uniref:Uncharacterized protein n=1 Tax=Eleusine coracana subsp. coracana TaxID=191504 RepID=A0AAV5CEY2_ELECO|nr:hypothetical protein PR202_ga13456 [Eleusine coracana subsp. coracana]
MDLRPLSSSLPHQHGSGSPPPPTRCSASAPAPALTRSPTCSRAPKAALRLELRLVDRGRRHKDLGEGEKQGRRLNVWRARGGPGRAATSPAEGGRADGGEGGAVTVERGGGKGRPAGGGGGRRRRVGGKQMEKTGENRGRRKKIEK